jgi:tetratricopeptide (TPR) repeat protein
MEIIKMFDEWKMKLLSINPKEFEELCFSLIQAMGFHNVIWRERGADKGRDLEAELIEILPDGFSEVTQKWFFECKLYEDSIPQNKISSKIDWAEAEKADRLAIMSNSHLSNQCRDYIVEKEKNINAKIIDWTGMRFLNILFSQPSVFKTYFPGENIPPQFLVQIEKENLLPFIEDRFMSMGLKRNMDLRKTSEFKISSEDPLFVKFVEDNVLTIQNLPISAKLFLHQMLVSVLFTKGDYEEAKKHNEILLSIDQDNELANINQGILLEETNKPNDALKWYDQILLQNPKNPLALNNKGHLFEKRGLNKRALKYFEKALEIAPDLEFIMVNKAKTLRKIGQLHQAISYIDQEIQKRPKSYILWNAKADILLKELDLKPALDCVNKALDINPRFVEAYNNKGVILEHNGKYQLPEKFNHLALEIFERVTELNPNYELGWTNMLVCFEHLEEEKEFEKLYNILEKKFPLKSMSLSKRGGILLKEGKLDEALDLLKKALELDKNNFDAIIKECEIYLKKNKFKKVWRITRKYVNKFKDPDFIFRLYLIMSDAWAGLGKNKKAQKCFQKAEKIRPIPISLIENDKINQDK